MAVAVRRRRRRRSDELGKEYGKNLKMNNEVYAQRRKVMDIVYSVRDLVDFRLPRIQVRINERVCCAVGVARLNRNELWITDYAVKEGGKFLYQVVLHEICHAVFGTKHHKGCPLMDEVVQHNATKSQLDKAFKKYAKQFNK